MTTYRFLVVLTTANTMAVNCDLGDDFQAIQLAMTLLSLQPNGMSVYVYALIDDDSIPLGFIAESDAFHLELIGGSDD